MIRSSVTISLVPEAKGGPFVFWGDLKSNGARAASIGFDAIEIFPASAEALRNEPVQETLSANNLKLAAVGSGGGWVLNRWHLSDPDPKIRSNARRFIGDLIDAAGELGAPVIIGSMQGKAGNGVSVSQAIQWLEEALAELGKRAKQYGVPLLLEPLNRYETNLLNRMEQGVDLLKSLPTKNVLLLADLFHMNIEESSIPATLTFVGPFLGHVHFVDSNRRPAGYGHIDFDAVAQALGSTPFDGYASAEALPYPDSETAAEETLKAYREHLLQ